MSSSGGRHQPHRACLCNRLQSHTPKANSFPQNTSAAQCDAETASLCPVCVSRALRPILEKQRKAEMERNRLRQWCANQLTEIRREQSSGDDPSKGKDLEGCDNGNDLTRLRDETDRLRAKLTTLRQACGSAAINLAALVVQNDERESLFLEQRSVVDGAMGGLHRLSNALLCQSDDDNSQDNSGGLVGAIYNGTEEVRLLRFRFALQSFQMHRLDIGPEYQDMIRADSEKEANGTNEQSTTASPQNRLRQRRFANKSPSGIGKIGGLPLPHAGPSLYEMLPPEVLCSSLRLVASLTSTLARCLGIVLPHPIILRDDNRNGESSRGSGFNESFSLGANQNRDIIDSRHSGGVRRVAMDEKSVNRRLRHATCAILRENDEAAGNGVELVDYELIAPQWNSTGNNSTVPEGIHSNVDSSATLARDDLRHQEERFATGLQLLQNDVVALCIRAGVPVQTLWPAEALLLNLNALLLHCQQQIESSSAIGAVVAGA